MIKCLLLLVLANGNLAACRATSDSGESRQAAHESRSDELDDALAGLRIWCNSKDFLPSRVGINCPAVFELARHRYSATAKILEELSTKGSNYDNYSNSLFYVLGVIRDPDSIPWLNSHIDVLSLDRHFDNWITAWADLPRGRMAEDLLWLDNNHAWLNFLMELSNHDVAQQGTRRTRLMLVIMRYFHTDQSHSFMAQEYSRADCSPVLRPLIAAYRHDYGLHDRCQDFPALVRNLRPPFARDSDDLLAVRDVPTAAFIPICLEVLDRTGSHTAVEALQWITLEFDLQSVQDWKDWLANHASESREDWVRRCCERLRNLASKDLGAARKFITNRAPQIADMDFLDTILELAREPTLQQCAADWLIAAYRPARASQLHGLVDILFEDGGVRLAPDTREYLVCFRDNAVNRSEWAQYLSRRETIVCK